METRNNIRVVLTFVPPSVDALFYKTRMAAGIALLHCDDVGRLREAMSVSEWT